MVAHDNRLLSKLDELLDANGVTFEDRHIRKEAGAVTYDTTSVGFSVLYSTTLGASDTYVASVLSFPATGTPALVRAGGTNRSALGGGGQQLVLSVPAAGHASGNLLVLCISAVFGTPPPSSYSFAVIVQDSKGNTYTLENEVFSQVGSPPNPGPLASAVAWSRLGTSLVSGDTITITFAFNSSAFNVASACSAEFSGVNGNRDRLSQATAVSASTTSGLAPPESTLPSLVIGAITVQTNGSITEGNSFTSAVTSATGPTSHLAYRADSLASAPYIIALYDWQSGVEIASGGTIKAATTAGTTTVTGSAGTLWNSGTEAQRIFPGDTIRIYGAGDEEHVVLSVASDTSLTTVDPWQTTFAASDFYVLRGNRLIVATTGGTIFKERNQNLEAVTLATGLSPSAIVGKFIPCGKEGGGVTPRRLMYVNGFDPVQMLLDDGASMSNITTPATPDWDNTAQASGRRPINGTVHANRLVMIGPRSFPHTMYLSDPADHSNFTNANSRFMQVRSDIGNRLWNLVAFQGVLFLWKDPVGIFYVDDSDPEPNNWIIQTKSVGLGSAPSPYSVVSVGDDVLFLTSTGAFHLLSAVDTLGGTRASDLGYALGISKWLRDNLNLSRLNQALSVYFAYKKQAFFSLPGAGSNVNNLLLKFDFAQVTEGGPVRFSYSRRDTPTALGLMKCQTTNLVGFADGVVRPVMGEGGHLKQLDQDARDKDGAGYTGSVQTPHLDFSEVLLPGTYIPDKGMATRRKNYELLELIFNPVGGTSSITVQVFVDQQLRQTLVFDGTKRRQRQKLQVGDGYTISLAFSNNLADQDFKILAAVVWFKLGTEDQSRTF